MKVSLIHNILRKVGACVEDNVLKSLPRSMSNRIPANLGETLVTESLLLHDNVEWRRQFLEAFDLVQSELDRRFDWIEHQRGRR